MKRRLQWIARHEHARFIGLGMVTGLILLTVALVWRGARSDTIVLNVQPVDNPRTIRVYVGGAVMSPGLYTLERGSRVADAISAAGGITQDGDTSSLGMAAPLRDADQIIIPAKSTAAATSVVANEADAAPSARAPININTADAEQLNSLPGIGPAIAGRIIDYRQRNGFFRSVEELDNIEGISERMVEELRPLVTIGP
ncbi:MAG TPA: helix-hairpin-helix domain-containing protein [Thermomicrobiales bacterium]|nr:helix-hairpin-helix domain-containing protein [Thermomicrobiales bacterium]